MNTVLSELPGKILPHRPVMPGNWRLLETRTFTVCPNPQPPPSSFVLPSLVLLSPSCTCVLRVFLINQTDKYWCAQGLCYDIFIVCVHVEDVDVNTAFYHTFNAASAY